MSDLKLLDLYTQILEDVGLTVNEDGEVLDGKSKPLKITFEGTKRPLVMPNEKQLKRTDSHAVLYFHPACESLYRGRSEVLNALAIMMAGRIHFAALMVTTAVLEFGADKDAHKKAPQRKAEILFKLPTISKPTMASWKALMPTLTLPGEQGKRPLMRLNLTRSIEMDDGTKYKRGCLINFPILEEEDSYNPDLTNVAKEAIHNALELTLGAESYFVGSNANTAPYLDALLRCYNEVMSHIHDIAERVAPYLVGGKEIPPYKGDWVDGLKQLGELYKRDLNMSLDGNQGRGGDEEPEEVKPATTPAPAPSKPRIAAKGSASTGAAPQPRQPAAPAPAPTPSSGGGSGLGLRRPGDARPPAPSAPPAQPQPAAQPQVTYDPYGNPIDPRTGYPYPPQQGYGQPAYGQPAYPQGGYDPRFPTPPQPTYDPRFGAQPGYPQAGYDPRFGGGAPQAPSGYYDATGTFHPYR